VERVYVHADVADAFTAALCAAADRLRLGPPADASTTLGPLARGAAAAAHLAAQCADALAKGAAIAYQTPPERMPPPATASPSIAAPSRARARARAAGAGRPGRGVFFPATVLVGCDHSMGVMREESFGPLIAIQTVRSDGEAVALMNDSVYGLTAAVFTQDERAALAILRRLVRGQKEETTARVCASVVRVLLLRIL
jgi:acyl-CoA reductase-like NAD-dependent aldehyde dehydrogenase